MLLNFSKWNRINESAQPDAVYITINLDYNFSVKEAVKVAIAKLFDSVKSVCKLDNITENSVKISLIENDTETSFSSIGIDLTLEIPYNPHTTPMYENQIARVIYSKFQRYEPQVSKEQTNEHIIFSLTGDAVTLSDDDIIADIIDASEFNRSMAVRGISLKEAEEVFTPDNIEEAFLTIPFVGQPKVISKFESALSPLIKKELSIMVLEQAKPFNRKPVYLKEYAENIETQLNYFESLADRLNSVDITSPEKLEVVKKIFELQVQLGKVFSKHSVERNVAIDALLRSYDIMQSLGITTDDITKAVGKPNK